MTYVQGLTISSPAEILSVYGRLARRFSNVLWGWTWLSIPPNVKDALDLRWPPYANQASLPGLSWALFGLHHHPSVVGAVSACDRGVLDRIEGEQREAMRECVEQYREGPEWWAAFVQGYCSDLSLLE